MYLLCLSLSITCFNPEHPARTREPNSYVSSYSHPSKPLLLFAGAPIIIQLKNTTLDYVLLSILRLKHRFSSLPVFKPSSLL